MTKIQGKYTDLKLIFDRLKLQGKDETRTTKSLIYGCILRCENNIIKCSVMNMSCTILGFFEFYNIKVLEDGEIPIGNLEEFTEFLNRFSKNEEITIETTENKIIIRGMKPKKKASINMIAKEHIEDSSRAEEVSNKLEVKEDIVKFNELELKNKFVVNSANIKDILEDGDIKSFTRIFTFDFSETGIKCLIGKENENNIEAEIPIISGKGNCRVLFQAGIDNAFNNITGNATIFVEENSPMYISSETETHKCKFVIAQVVE